MVQVTSEIGRLERVLLHEPGPEIDRMPPAMMEQLLFDDILYGDRARTEHARFRRVLQLFGVEVLEANRILTDALATPGARDWLARAVLPDLPLSEPDLARSDAADLTSLLVAGSPPRPNPTGVEVEDLYDVPPLPNWCFQRDPQVVVGDGVIFSRMAAPARRRESLLARCAFRFHDELSRTRVWYDPLEGGSDGGGAEQRGATLEGGDALVVAPELLVIGQSERTNAVAIAQLARSLAAREGAPRWLIVVSFPRRRAYMHLDTLLTPVDRDACLVHAPVILPGGHEAAEVGEIDLHSRDLRTRACGALLDALARRGVDYEPILCGGPDPLAQQREQWTDGANALALAPGVITLFDRNERTTDELGRHGFRVVTAEDLLLGREEVEIDAGRRVCILIASNEMSRARGGPHCLAHPLRRR